MPLKLSNFFLAFRFGLVVVDSFEVVSNFTLCSNFGVDCATPGSVLAERFRPISGPLIGVTDGSSLTSGLTGGDFTFGEIVGWFRLFGVGVRRVRLVIVPDGTATSRWIDWPCCTATASDKVSVVISSKLPRPLVQFGRTDSVGLGSDVDVTVAPVPGPENDADEYWPGNV